jgi:hypothetical protein
MPKPIKTGYSSSCTQKNMQALTFKIKKASVNFDCNIDDVCNFAAYLARAARGK